MLMHIGVSGALMLPLHQVVDDCHVFTTEGFHFDNWVVPRRQTVLLREMTGDVAIKRVTLFAEEVIAS
jgi:hypothetical protein